MQSAISGHSASKTLRRMLCIQLYEKTSTLNTRINDKIVQVNDTDSEAEFTNVPTSVNKLCMDETNPKRAFLSRGLRWRSTAGS
jgi:negative regulator of replication initiation